MQKEAQGQSEQAVGYAESILVTISEAARLLAVSPRTIYRLIERGELDCYKVIADAPRIRRSDLNLLLERTRVEVPAAEVIG